MNRAAIRSMKLLSALALAGCGNSSHSTVGDMATSKAHDLSTALADLAGVDLAGVDMAMAAARDMAKGPDLFSATYPAGPYGHNVGDIIPMLTWEGYSDPLADAIASSKTYGSYSMNDLRLSGRPYAAVHVAEFT